ncbi:MAG: hypothetical protein DCE90_16700 [Pseudanabaena sp.]|nr:MAG: hypothetical protein DCE90_16700 [Pseudanabaena sp.]
MLRVLQFLTELCAQTRTKNNIESVAKQRFQYYSYGSLLSAVAVKIAESWFSFCQRLLGRTKPNPIAFKIKLAFI